MIRRSWAATALAMLALMTALPGHASPATPLRQALSAEGVPGAVWSIVDAKGTQKGAVGYSHGPNRTPMLPTHRVHVGSVTKTLVALGILALVSQGRLTLDAPLAPLLPDLAFDNRWSASHPLRVRHLLDHTAGLQDARLWQLFSTATRPDMPLRNVLLRDPALLRSRTPPGDVFSYSNIGYTIAALLIERVTGERYERWLATELLRPIGMIDSSFEFVSQTGPARDPRLAWGHLGSETPVVALPMAVRPAAQFTTTAADMARLGRFLLDGRAGTGQSLISPHLLKAMGAPVGTAAVRSGLSAGYALGLARRDRDGRIGLCHQGDTVGYHALFCIYPDIAKASFLALNNDGDDINLARFHDAIASAVAPTSNRFAPLRPAPTSADAWKGYYVPLVSRFTVTRYADLLTAGATLRRDGRALMLERSGSAPIELYADHGHLLRAAKRSAPSHVLMRNAADGLLISDGQRTFRRVAACQVYALWTGLIVGFLSLVYLLFITPILAQRAQRTILQPATVAILCFVPVGLLLTSLPFQRWGDLTLASAALAAATFALPLAAAAQLIVAARNRAAGWSCDLLASVGLLQWCVVLAWFGLWPIILWR